jgi:hypothetical protein
LSCISLERGQSAYPHSPPSHPTPSDHKTAMGVLSSSGAWPSRRPNNPSEGALGKGWSSSGSGDHRISLSTLPSPNKAFRGDSGNRADAWNWKLNLRDTMRGGTWGGLCPARRRTLQAVAFPPGIFSMCQCRSTARDVNFPICQGQSWISTYQGFWRQSRQSH